MRAWFMFTMLTVNKPNVKHACVPLEQEVENFWAGI